LNPFFFTLSLSLQTWIFNIAISLASFTFESLNAYGLKHNDAKKNYKNGKKDTLILYMMWCNREPNTGQELPSTGSFIMEKWLIIEL
jgi:hypothetical protein